MCCEHQRAAAGLIEALLRPGAGRNFLCKCLQLRILEGISGLHKLVNLCAFSGVALPLDLLTTLHRTNGISCEEHVEH